MRSNLHEIEIKIIKSIDLKNKKVLEVGCGEGRFTSIIAEKASKVTAISPFPEEIEAATLLNLPNTTFQVMDGRDLKFPENVFDCVLFTFSLHHITDLQKALREAIRVLKSKGEIILMEPDIDSQYNELFYIIHDEREEVLAARKAINKLLPNHHSSKFSVEYFFKNEEDLIKHFSSSEEDFYHLDLTDEEKKSRLLSKVNSCPVEITDTRSLVSWEKPCP